MFQVIINQESKERNGGGGGGGPIAFKDLPEVGDKVFFVFNHEEPASSGKVISVETEKEVTSQYENEDFKNIDAVITLEV